MSENFLYVQIYKKILEDIKQDKYKQGDKLPTEKEISEKYKVSRITAQRAMNILVEDGEVVRFPGVGSFVSKEEHDTNENTKAKEKKTIGLVVEAIWASFGIKVFEGAYRKAEELGYNLVLKKSYGDQEIEMEAIEELIRMGAEGIIIMPVHGDYYSDRILKLFVDGYPIVFIDRYLHGIHVPFVSSDNILATKKAVEHLIGHGHSHIALVTAPDQETTTLDDRKQGFIQSHLDNGLLLNKEYIYDKIQSRLPGEAQDKALQETVMDIKSFLNSNSEITAVIAAEHFIAELTKVAAEDIGKRVHGDIEIICFDSPESILNQYDFTHIRQNETEMGKIAVKMLNSLIIEEKIEEEHVLLDVELILGNVTRDN